MKMIAVIPARGGSKRLLRKNVIQFRGKPIIAYTIEAALKTELFERVIVSTEDQEIAEVAKQYGAEIVMRPQFLATDAATVIDVCLHLVESESSLGRNYDILCCLYATAPLRSAKDIKETVELVKTGQSDFAIAVTDFHFPPHQALVKNSQAFLETMWPDISKMKSENVPSFLVDNGSTYVVSVPELLKTQSFYGPRLKGYYMPRTRSVDIDVAEDLAIAELFGKEAGK